MLFADWSTQFYLYYLRAIILFIGQACAHSRGNIYILEIKVSDWRSVAQAEFNNNLL